MLSDVLAQGVDSGSERVVKSVQLGIREIGEKSAAELLAELQADHNWVDEKAKREQELRERTALYRKAEEPLIRDLNLSGVSVSSVWDLVNTEAPYPDAGRS